MKIVIQCINQLGLTKPHTHRGFIIVSILILYQSRIQRGGGGGRPYCFLNFFWISRLFRTKVMQFIVCICDKWWQVWYIVFRPPHFFQNFWIRHCTIPIPMRIPKIYFCNSKKTTIKRHIFMLYKTVIHTTLLRNWQGCRCYGNSHGDSHRYGYGMGMGTMMNTNRSVSLLVGPNWLMHRVIVFIHNTVWQYFTLHTICTHKQQKCASDEKMQVCIICMEEFGVVWVKLLVWGPVGISTGFSVGIG